MSSKAEASKRRKRMVAACGSSYVPFKPPGYWAAGCCAYCGNLAQTKDHIPPITWLYALGTRYFDDRGLLVVWVPACKQCNSLIGDKKLFTIHERTVYLWRKYVELYKNIVINPAWDDYEINTLRGRLKDEIGNFANCQRAADRRLAILEENIGMRSMQS